MGVDGGVVVVEWEGVAWCGGREEEKERRACVVV